MGNTVDLNAAGISEATGSIITASSLRLQGTGTFSLANANTVGTLAANINGTLNYTDANALTIGTVLGTNGLTTSNDNVVVSAGGALSLAQAVSVGPADLRLVAVGGISQTAAGTITAGLFGASAARAGSLVDVEVLARAGYRANLPSYWYRGQNYVEGRQNQEFRVRLRNKSADRVMAVLSVDGVNAISGETAGALLPNEFLT